MSTGWRQRGEERGKKYLHQWPVPNGSAKGKWLLLYGKPVMTCMMIENGHSSCLWSPTAQGLGTGWDINHSLTGKETPPHFLPDLAERHFQVSNYHYGAKATPAALQRGVLASP
ncbi:hypothetical protein QQF64_028779 [Cirrhinus molitorella]|uniref:Uncharacterized protein n=1 Tax=Cirrhinus molitorella TaxID=172907 RepID=A0ABR3N7Y5_9TELE